MDVRRTDDGVFGRAGRRATGDGGAGRVRNVFGERVLGTDVGYADVGSFAGFGESIVAGVEVLAFLEARNKYQHPMEMEKGD